MLLSSMLISNYLLVERNQASKVSASQTIMDVKESVYEAAENKMDALIALPVFAEQFELDSMLSPMTISAAGDAAIKDMVFATDDGSYVTIGAITEGYDPTTRPWYIEAVAANGQTIKATVFPVDRQKVSQGLGGMTMAAITGIDNRNGCILRSHIRSAFLGMPDSHNIRIARKDLGSIGHTFTLGG